MIDICKKCNQKLIPTLKLTPWFESLVSTLYDATAAQVSESECLNCKSIVAYMKYDTHLDLEYEFIYFDKGYGICLDAQIGLVFLVKKYKFISANLVGEDADNYFKLISADNVKYHYHKRMRLINLS